MIPLGLAGLRDCLIVVSITTPTALLRYFLSVTPRGFSCISAGGGECLHERAPETLAPNYDIETLSIYSHIKSVPKLQRCLAPPPLSEACNQHPRSH
jgi:hypothetical protein